MPARESRCARAGRLTSPFAPSLPKGGLAALLALLLLAFALPLDARAEGLDVGIRKVEKDEFPRVRVIFDVRSFDKLPFRRLTAENVQLAEEEVAIRDFELLPYRSGVSIGLVVDASG
ncbi:MAG: hypothetical protein HY303_17615, partial [Candidatus Wallbacteria bacterium]|nr:hypothetical protein [Candidatus Wallbacteria bacterium]